MPFAIVQLRIQIPTYRSSFKVVYMLIMYVPSHEIMQAYYKKENLIAKPLSLHTIYENTPLVNNDSFNGSFASN